MYFKEANSSYILAGGSLYNQSKGWGAWPIWDTDAKFLSEALNILSGKEPEQQGIATSAGKVPAAVESWLQKTKEAISASIRRSNVEHVLSNLPYRP